MGRMKKIDLGQTITVLANLGVIASLVFLGLQVRQEAAASVVGVGICFQRQIRGTRERFRG